jgi:hypothetical protein
MKNFSDGRSKLRIDEIETLYPMPKHERKRLEDRKWIFDHVKVNGVGAEIGVFRGHFSSLLCEHLTPKRLYLIDPWRLLGKNFNLGKAYTSDGKLTTEIALEQTKLRVAEHPDVDAVVIEGFYPGCDDKITDELDFAYLDSSHKYESTFDELMVLSRRIKVDGTIFGDDWCPNPSARLHDVYRAVQEFVRLTDWEVVAAGPAEQWALKRKGQN